MPKPHRTNSYNMKNVLVWFAALIMVFVSCSDGGEEPTGGEKPVDKASITLDSSVQASGLNFTNEGGEKSVSFSTTADWVISIAKTANGSTWCTPSATSGTKGNATVKFTVAENSLYDNRSVAVTIKAGDASKTFTITQKQKEGFLVTSNKCEVEQAGGTIEVEVKANINYQLELSEAAKSWITPVATRGLTAKKHAFTVASNEELEKREGEIYVKSGDKVETIKVYQAGGPLLLLSKNEYTVSDKGEVISVDIKSNIEFGIIMPEVDWIRDAEATRGASSHTRNFVVEPNEEYDARSSVIVFYDKNSDLKDTLTVKQAQKDAIVLSQKEYVVQYEGGSLNVKLATNVDFEITTPGVDWIYFTGVVNTRGLEEQILGFDVYQNNSEETRTAEIVFTGKDSQLSESVIIRQGAYETFYVMTPGTLQKQLEKEYGTGGVKTLTSLKLSGTINDSDLYYLGILVGNSVYSYDIAVDATKQQAGRLAYLDLSDVVIEGGEISKGHLGYARKLKELKLPKSPTVVGALCPSCKELTNVEINGATELRKTFTNCTSLTSITIPDNVTIISGTFYGCTALSSVTLGKGVKSIGDYAFNGCTALTSIIVPDSVTIIDGGAFYNCTSLTSIVVPDNVTNIGGSAFAGCTALSTVTLGKELTAIGSYAFSGCTSLTSVVNTDKIASIEPYVFYDCSALTSVTIGKEVTKIGSYAFSGCSSLTSVTFLGNKVDTLEDGAFRGCSSLPTLTLPESVTTIGLWAFTGCSSLTSINLPKNVTAIGKEAFNGCSSLTSIVVPDKVAKLEWALFSGCTAMKSATIGSGVTYIDDYVFEDCTSMSTITCLATTPPDTRMSWTFYNMAKNVTLYVPAGCGDAYKKSYDWQDFEDDNIKELE